MDHITLSNGKKALIDPEDFERLSPHKWYYLRTRQGCEYTFRTSARRMIYMHRQICAVPKDEHVDHINGDGLDNRKTNLRRATAQQNQWNRRKFSKRTSSQFKGVSWV